ncbi:MAG: alpha-ketoglutarate-dependent dioxygenase AlkB [Bacteroidota bacterium]
MKLHFPTDRITYDLPDATISYYPSFFTNEEANSIYKELMEKTEWQQDKITLFGKTHLQPRLTALYANNCKPYSYSNITMRPHGFTLLLEKIKAKIETVCEEDFTTVLLNLYRNGKDSNGWHADNEKELGNNPTIASVSFGAERSFHLKHNTIKEARLKLVLEHGSLLIMEGKTQHFWKHQIPKTAKPINPRINLTFRKIEL